MRMVNYLKTRYDRMEEEAEARRYERVSWVAVGISAGVLLSAGASLLGWIVFGW